MKIKIPKYYKYIGTFLSMRCQLHCSFCLNNLDKKLKERTKFKEIPWNEWAESLNQFSLPKDVPLTFSGGEPMFYPGFIDLINNLDKSLNIDILTNFYSKPLVKKFINEVNPKRIMRDAPYPSIRVSYHPEQMDANTLIENVKEAQDAGFSIGIFSVLYPSSQQLSSIVQMQFLCRKAGIDFRLKDYTGVYNGEIYGNYSKYPGAFMSKNLKTCLCRTSDLIIGPNGNIYKCHRDLYKEEFPVGNIKDKFLKIDSKFRYCNKYGECHPCDIKYKTNFKQKLGHTTVEVKNAK
jgi:MoaA/NifB/PqqE/SkfB family radical SAM enzyme